MALAKNDLPVRIGEIPTRTFVTRDPSGALRQVGSRWSAASVARTLGQRKKISVQVPGSIAQHHVARYRSAELALAQFSSTQFACASPGERGDIMDKKHPNEPKAVTPSEPPPVQAKHGDILIDGVKIEYDRQAPPPATEEDPAPKAESDTMQPAFVAAGAEVEIK